MHHINQNDAPDLIGRDAVAAEVIPTIREVVNEQPLLRLRGDKVKEIEVAKPVSKHVELGREYGRVERGFFEQLSRYYPWDKGKWVSMDEFNALVTFHLPAFLSVLRDLGVESAPNRFRAIPSPNLRYRNA
jgi:hypothetical protein